MKPPDSLQTIPSSVFSLTAWLKREYLLIWIGLAALIVLTWFDLLRRAGVFAPAELGRHMMMPHAASWTLTDAFVTGTMWIVMMAAMMLPSAAPMVLLYSGVTLRRRARGNPAAPTGIFLLGYLLVWAGFSVLATAAQWGLHTLLLLSPHLSFTSSLLGGATLVLAGGYQFTRLKETCLKHCQSPLDFLGTHWREGTRGALLMGIEHGLYCVGCCWALMLVLFVGGVMNLTWIALLAAFVLLERVATRGMPLSYVSGVVLIAWGLVLLSQGLPIQGP